ncbi:RNA-binding domain-containing protein [Dendrothele bispora CBS 962.96]|uniref:RNA-binding domain-containing protein n=1 Tax=Dendrothele bispora (strain CBS 962.96) TaxID=1314807 RepID=A0A4S8MNQ2_DENBC|nr:RNA-binding domain-containing protein [Dendrothele bispora CBS 962.96]
MPEEATISRPIEKTKKAKTVSSKLKAKLPKPIDDDEEQEEDEEMDDDQEGGVNEAEEEDDDEVMIHGFSTDDDDSSDDEDFVEPSGIDVGRLPTIAKDDATVKRKLEKAKREPTEDRGVLYLGRIPHGFYEDQLKAYFSQFGDVTRLRVSRNKKTGRSKHYAFLEFDSSSVAQIVAETMDNYLLMGHILRCKVIPKDQVHPELWVGADRKWRVVPRDRVARVAHNKLRTKEEQIKASKRLIKRQNDRKRKLEEMGISYNFDAVGYKKPAIAA